MKVLVKEGGYFYKCCTEAVNMLLPFQTLILFLSCFILTLICLSHSTSLKIKSSSAEVVPLVFSHNSGWPLLCGLI